MIRYTKHTQRLFMRPRFLAVTVASFAMVGAALAEINVTGDYSPTTTSFWTDGGALEEGVIGDADDGSLNITEGSVLTLKQASFGRDEGATGTVTIEDSGSALTVQQNLYIGYDGTGNLLLQNGGMISTTVNEGFLGYSSSGVGTATVRGAGSQMSIKDDFRVGNYGSGTLFIEDGGYVYNDRYSYLAYYTGSMSSATVTGEGSEWLSNSRMYAGLYGTATLNLEEGALVTVNDYAYLGYYGRDSDSSRGNGTAIITGAGSEWNVKKALFVGYWGTGILRAEDGGVVTERNQDLLIGFAGSGVGTATVTGAGSQINVNKEVYLGYYGSGTLNIEDGGVVNNNATYIGARERSDQGRGIGTATVTGTGSQWNMTDFFVVGRSGTGYLNLEAGGVVSNVDGYIATSSYESTDDYTYLGAGAVKVTGSGSQWNNSGNLYAGYDGVGSLSIGDAGLVTSVDGYLGYNTGSAGTIDVSGAGSRLNHSGNLYVGFSGTGYLSIGDGGSVSAGDITVNSGSRVNLFISGSDTLLSASGTLSSATDSVYLFADGSLAAGSYSPIAAGTFNDAADHYVAVGGLWDANSHMFTVAAVEERFTGVTNEDVSNERVEFVDSSLILSFSDSVGVISLTASQEETVAVIEEQFVLGAYFFDLQAGDLSGQHISISYSVGEGYISDAFTFWREETQGASWEEYSPLGASYADGWVNFVVEGFSGYAVTVTDVVPEPATYGLIFGNLALAMVAIRRRQRTVVA